MSESAKWSIKLESRPAWATALGVVAAGAVAGITAWQNVTREVDVQLTKVLALSAKFRPFGPGNFLYVYDYRYSLTIENKSEFTADSCSGAFYIDDKETTSFLIENKNDIPIGRFDILPFQKKVAIFEFMIFLSDVEKPMKVRVSCRGGDTQFLSLPPIRAAHRQAGAGG